MPAEKKDNQSLILLGGEIPNQIDLIIEAEKKPLAEHNLIQIQEAIFALTNPYQLALETRAFDTFTSNSDQKDGLNPLRNKRQYSWSLANRDKHSAVTLKYTAKKDSIDLNSVSLNLRNTSPVLVKHPLLTAKFNFGQGPNMLTPHMTDLMLEFNAAFSDGIIHYAQGGLERFIAGFCCSFYQPNYYYEPGTINIQFDALPSLSYYRPRNLLGNILSGGNYYPEHSFLFQYQPTEDCFHRRLTDKLYHACQTFGASAAEFLSIEEYLALLKSVLNLIPTKQLE